ncbi:MAG: hypothetical protein JW819_12950 [Candidatus Krumholzibacteriota bacterium]|nr:hypothetical protein [Candidatus Krumholzibacteriota bacterium]
MPAPPLASQRGRVLLDASLWTDPAGAAALAERLHPILGARRLALLWPGEAAPGRVAAACDAVLIDAAAPSDLSSLAAAQARGDLAGDLFVTANAKRAEWARQRELPVVALAPGEDAAARLAAPALLREDAAALVTAFQAARERRPLIVGVNGIDKSGKTRFAAGLAAELRRRGRVAETLSVESFLAPRRLRAAHDYPPVERYYRKRYDLERLRDQALRPLREEGRRRLRIDVYDGRRERTGEELHLAFGETGLLIVEGPFLFRADLFYHFDFRIYLVTDFERALDLSLADVPAARREARRRALLAREVAAQQLYLRQETPWQRAHLVLRDVNGDAPSIEAVQLGAPDASSSPSTARA